MAACPHQGGGLTKDCFGAAADLVGPSQSKGPEDEAATIGNVLIFLRLAQRIRIRGMVTIRVVHTSGGMQSLHCKNKTLFSKIALFLVEVKIATYRTTIQDPRVWSKRS